MNVKILQVGDKVKWSSQAQGSVKKKAGVVYVVVEAGRNAKDFLPEGLVNSQIKFDNRYSKTKRYIVEIPRGGKSTKSDYYCPRVESLQMNNG